jgi:hypothetical protein
VTVVRLLAARVTNRGSRVLRPQVEVLACLTSSVLLKNDLGIRELSNCRHSGNRFMEPLENLVQVRAVSVLAEAN